MVEGEESDSPPVVPRRGGATISDGSVQISLFEEVGRLSTGQFDSSSSDSCRAVDLRKIC